MKLVKKEEGSVIVIFALAMVVFMTFLAFVTDVGLFYLQRTRLQNALDAAVLAGAQDLPFDPVAAKNVALDYVSKNGMDPTQVEINIDNNGKAISGQSKIPVKFNFAKILGINQATASATSSAKIAPVSAVTGIVPLSIQDQELHFGREYVLKLGHGANGWFGPLALGGNGANVYRENLLHGYDHLVKIGDVLPTETGNMSGPTNQGLKELLEQENHYPACTPENYHWDCSRLVTIPVVAPYSTQGQVKEVTVVGFASFLLKGVQGNGNDCIVTGYFVKSLANAETADSQTDFGLYGVKLNK